MPKFSSVGASRPVTSPATIAGAIQFDIASSASCRTYRIYVRIPLEPPPAAGYSILYVIDGNWFFATAALQAEFLEAECGPMLVVGIGYPTDNRGEYAVLRIRDLTARDPEGELSKEIAAYTTAELERDEIFYGGSEEFLGFITEELQPVIARMFHVDLNKEAIFGDSLGGLFALYALCRRPAKFRTCVAGSPSIWWNDRAVMKEVAGFKRVVESQQVVHKVMITVGSLEESVERIPTPRRVSRERVEEMVRRCRMVDNARELASELKAIRAPPGYTVELHVFDGETHQGVVATTISRAISFALRP
jgi:predicted alpha/beta superfamily hydrolase